MKARQMKIRNYFANLDAFRFLSFLSVFISHTLQLTPAPNFLSGFFMSLFTFNFLGVPSFFTLSSFLITYRLLLEAEKCGKIGLANFYKNRILRIWPAYYLLISICFIILPIGLSSINLPSPTLPNIFPFLLFFANFYIIENGMNFTFALSILWSISIEEQFYLVWGIVMKMAKRNMIGTIIIVFFIMSILFSYYYLHVLHNPAYNLAVHSLFVLQNFCTGAYIAFICVKKDEFFYFLKKLPGIFFLIPYLILPIAFIMKESPILMNVILSSCYSLIIYDLSINEKRNFNIANSSLINYWGKISYGLYIYHALVFVILQKLFYFFIYPSQPSLLVNLFQMGVTFIITVFVAHVSYKYIEARFLALKTVII